MVIEYIMKFLTSLVASLGFIAALAWGRPAAGQGAFSGKVAEGNIAAATEAYRIVKAKIEQAAQGGEHAEAD